MKIAKYILFIPFSVLMHINGFAGDVEINIPNFAGRVHYFTGFEFGSYVPSPVGLEGELVAENAKIAENEKNTGAADYYTLIGHSQGALRSLAQSTYLKSNNPAEYNKLQAVITVSGIDKGLLALDGGFGPLSAKFNSHAGTVYNGLKSTIAAVVDIISLIPGWQPGGYLLQFITHHDFLYPSTTSVRNWMLDMFAPAEFKCYIKPALNNADPNSMAEIRDMFPRSNFIQQRVASSQRHDYKVRTGTDIYLDWCVVATKKIFKKRINIWGWQWKSRPVYSWYTAWQDIPKIGNELPTGYIVGLDSNTLKMTGKEGDIRKFTTSMYVVFDIAYSIHSVQKWIPIWGWVMNSSTNAKHAHAARSYMRNIDSRLNDLKNSSENDGLVAKESQFIPKSFTHPVTGQVTYGHTNVLGKTSEGYVGYPQYNHKNISPIDKQGNVSNNLVMNKISDMIDEAKDLRKR